MMPVPPSATAPERNRWLILSAVSIGTFMATLDGSIVNISLPRIQEAFGVSLTTVEWVVLAYLLVLGSLLLPFGRLGELAGFRRVYLAGFAIFTIASAMCGAAPGSEALVAFRVIQGIGAAMLQAMGPAIVARTFGPGERGRALGINAISVSIGLSLGPALGGFLTEFATWRAIFLVNVPVGILAILWSARILPEDRTASRVGFDSPGAILSSVGLFALLLAMVQGQSWGWTSPVILGLLAGFVVAAAGFVAVELRAAEPMLDLALFRIRAFAAGNASLVVAFAGLFTATFLLPFLLEQGSGFTPLEAGLLITPIPIATAIVAPFSGSLSDRIGPRVPASLGIATMTLGMVALAGLPTEFAVPDLVWRLALVGVGQGLFMSPNSSAVLGAVPRARLGTASATLAQMRINGQALGVAASGAIVAIQTSAHAAALAGQMGPDAAAVQGGILAIHDAFLVAAVTCAVAIATSLVRGPMAAAASRPAQPG